MEYKEKGKGGMSSIATSYNDQYMSNISGSCPAEFPQDYMVKKVKAKPSNKNWNKMK